MCQQGANFFEPRLLRVIAKMRRSRGESKLSDGVCLYVPMAVGVSP